MTNIPLRELMELSFGVRPFQVVNAPEWTQNERFDIIGTIPSDVEPAPGIQSPKRRALLEERFKLMTHRETRESSVHRLVRARADGKVMPGYITMESFASWLSTRIEHIVLDRTGRVGPFQFELTFAPIANIDVIDRRGVYALALTTALQEHLGLNVESTRAPVEVLVIDSVDRPTPD